PDGRSLERQVYDEALQDNTQTPVPDQVMFRLDFPKWRSSRTQRDRRIVEDLMVGEHTRNVARKFSLSPARISQLRSEYHTDWLRFQGDPLSDAEASGAGAA